MSTPHINAKKGDFADTVLMPGDPYRSRFIAENYLNNAQLVNDVRGVQGYTGFYNGKKISVMASGMGMPSIGIYSYELYNFFGVENIIRVGSAGSYNADVKLRDIVLAQAACTDSNYAKQFGLPGDFSPIADFGLLTKAASKAESLGFAYHVGNILSSDRFYGDNIGLPEWKQPMSLWAKMGVLAVEMEAAALYMNAARAGKRALAICTVSDSLVTGEETSAEERQNSFTDMIKLALETAASI
ncbi:MAG: purine-nucleoside phosphorylase [Acutalibacteraceae bacterium]|nr:purine-nucleoside phosphorylase [Acutalibacteraceae bacterium]